MKLRIEIDCEGSAFGETPHERNVEASHILRRVMDALWRDEMDRDAAVLFDTNGNRVGFAAFQAEG